MKENKKNICDICKRNIEEEFIQSLEMLTREQLIKIILGMKEAMRR